MAWNRPSKNGEAVSRPLQERKGFSFPIRAAIAGAVVVLGAAVAAWWLWPSEKTRQDDASTKKTLIKEVTPAKPKLSAAEQEKLEHPGMVKVRGKWYPEYNEQGGKIWVSKHWIKYHTPVIYTNKMSEARIPIEHRIFTNKADQDIAVLINTPPGHLMIGSRKFDKNFERQFLESLKEPIIVTKDDDENAAALKRAVNQTKIDLKARYDAGEDIIEIMNDTDKKLRELGHYREELRHQLMQISREQKTDVDEAKMLYEAANKMLAERGCSPLKIPAPILYRAQKGARAAQERK